MPGGTTKKEREQAPQGDLSAERIWPKTPKYGLHVFVGPPTDGAGLPHPWTTPAPG